MPPDKFTFANCKLKHATYTVQRCPVFGDTGTASEVIEWSATYSASDGYYFPYTPPAWRTRRIKVDAAKTRLAHEIAEFSRRNWKI